MFCFSVSLFFFSARTFPKQTFLYVTLVRSGSCGHFSTSPSQKGNIWSWLSKTNYDPPFETGKGPTSPGHMITISLNKITVVLAKKKVDGGFCYGDAQCFLPRIGWSGKAHLMDWHVNRDMEVEIDSVKWSGGDRAFQAEGRACAKYLRLKEFGIFEDLKEDQCEWNTAGEGSLPWNKVWEQERGWNNYNFVRRGIDLRFVLSVVGSHWRILNRCWTWSIF